MPKVDIPAMLTTWIESCRALGEGAQTFSGADTVAQAYDATTRGRSRVEFEDQTQDISLLIATRPVGRSQLKILDWHSPTSCTTLTHRPRGHHLSMHIPLVGSFDIQRDGVWVPVKPGNALLQSAYGEIWRRWTGPFLQLNILVDRLAVDQFIAASDEVATILEATRTTLIELEQHTALTKYIDMVVSEALSEESILTESSSSHDVERLLVRLMLQPIRKSYSQLPMAARNAVAPHYVRAAERHIRKAYGEEISLEQLAHEVGVSVRTLQYGFRRFRQTTPMNFLRETRLSIARTSLLNGPRQNIIDIALSVGYKHYTFFSGDYRKAYGESPRETLRLRGDQ